MVTDGRYRADTGCAALADRRGDSMVATAPPAERWLLIESRVAWPRDALAALRPEGLGAEVARLCRQLGYRPALIRRYGRLDRTAPCRFALADCRPGRESVRWGELPSDEHLLNVLRGDAEPGPVNREPVYLVCTHGRHDACCAVRGRPVAAALAGAYPERTWECSHVGGDRFAANVVVLPQGLFYGHVPVARAVELAKHHDEGRVVPDLLRGSGAFVPPVQAAQHFARAAGHSLLIDELRPQAVRGLADHHWQVDLALPDDAGLVTVEVSGHLDTIDARLTCAGVAPATVRRFQLHSITSS
ncbi:sucrase ferredoxin [Kribbella pittospori]|uniref:sucrase ferredoxin n=1 Tax=Kribbella pittospori TaxID=722689 RepID=UPI0013F3AEFA|nr:sucrase ferredoxin [Kribbella pittospori]